ncbi:MAG TPA: hypothetical protein VFW95_08795 [Candidatus Limnocylindria bacterium]|nr:hypothetical protein [Candidatus Limnocylindria bacterium]
MTDTAFGFLLLGVAIVVVLGIVFAVTIRYSPRPKPPAGVHLPAPSSLPVILSAGAAVMGLGLVFKPDDQFANLFLLIPGVVIFIGGCVAWVRAANHEWRDTEHGSHGDGAH